MSIAELDTRIQKLQDEVNVLRSQAENHAKSFVTFVAASANAWVPEGAKALVTGHEAVTSKLIEDGRLAQMKASIEAARQTLVAHMEKDLLTERLWPHRIGYVDDGSRTPPDRGAVYRPLEGPHASANPPHALAKAASAALESVFGPIVAKHGYPHAQYGERHCFGDGFRFPEGFVPLLRDYSAVNTNLHAKVRELTNAQKERAKLVAAKEWDKA
jgi:hypothetical protein